MLNYTKEPQCRNVGGVWYSPNMPEGDRYSFSPPADNPGDGPYCNDPHHLAVTLKVERIIIFCKDVSVLLRLFLALYALASQPYMLQ